MSLSDSFAIPDLSVSDLDDVDSLPSSSTESFESEDDYDAQKEWEQSLEQLQLLLTMIIVPFAGKYFGRKFAYWSTSVLDSPGPSFACFTDLPMQAGHVTWNGRMTSRLIGRAKRHLKPRAPSEQPQLFKSD
ncbi:hypothetical protein RRF57_004266 [Xylaria bambusicola]|uniref:Uncharacterized protein n=1 Tax=Xylaria bambusicola TaxID=326684 RepID=A0AAN7Z8L1_9PEZI